jgi:hypothetical protein
MTEGEDKPRPDESDEKEMPPGSIYAVPVKGEKGEDVSQPATSKNAEDTRDPTQR